MREWLGRYTGQVGYLIANMKTAKEARVGDTLFIQETKVVPLPGLEPAKCMVRWCGWPGGVCGCWICAQGVTDRRSLAALVDLIGVRGRISSGCRSVRCAARCRGQVAADRCQRVRPARNQVSLLTSGTRERVGDTTTHQHVGDVCCVDDGWVNWHGVKQCGAGARVPVRIPGHVAHGCVYAAPATGVQRRRAGHRPHCTLQRCVTPSPL